MRIAVVLVASLLVLPLLAQAHAGSFAAVKTTTTVNVRSGPGTGYSIIGQATSGDKFVDIGSSSGWDKVWYKGRAGWIHGDYTAGLGFGLVTKITGSTVNVRSGPGTGYSDVGDVHEGESYVVHDSSDARSGGYNDIEYIWHKIQYGDGTGWVYDQYTNEGSVGGQVEPNFAEAELHSTYGSCTKFHISKDLTMRLQALRNRVGSVSLSNAYRCPDHNAAVGGSSTSYHISGQGADITYCGGLSYSTCASHARDVGLDALNEGDHLHVSVPQGGGV